MKKIQICFLLCIFHVYDVISQCHVTAFADRTEICEGDSVTLWATGGCGVLMYNDFNDGTPGQGWQATNGVAFNNPCGAGPDAIYLWMGHQVPIPRTLTTVPFNVQGGCQIRFYMRFSIQGQPSPCEGPDEIDEGISVQYSVNNGNTWTDIVYFRPDGIQLPTYPGSSSQQVVGNNQQTPFTTWAQYTYNIPAAAHSPNTLFRWRQHAYTSQSYDHWGLDIVEILCPQNTLIQWSHGPTVHNPPQVSPTQTTTYYVTVYDPIMGTSAVDSITIIVHPRPQISIAPTQPQLCDGQSIQLTATSSLASTNFVWSTNTNGSNIQVQPTTTTTYSVTGTTQYQCSGTASVQVNVNPIPTLTVQSSSTELCAGQSATITVSSNLPNTSFEWNIPATGNSVNVMPSVTTTYQVTGTTQYNCSGTASIVITVNPVPQITLHISDTEICAGDQVTMTASSNIQNTSFEWSTGIYGSQLEVHPAATTQYTVTGTTSSNCSASAAVQVVVNQPPQVSIGVSSSQICQGQSVSLWVESNQPIITYQWSNQSSDASIVVQPLQTTDYVVTVTTPQQCSGSASTTITVLPNPVVTISTPQQAFCAGGSTTLISQSDIPVTNWFWNTGDSSQEITVSPSQTTTYNVTATTGTQCSGSASIMITVYQNPIADFHPSSFVVDMMNPQIEFQNHSHGGHTYVWNMGDGTIISNIEHPYHTYLVDGKYEVCLTVISAHGCQDSVCKRIIVKPLTTLYIPNVISPDGNGINDVFYIAGTNIDIEQFELRIMDRWGKELFHTKNVNQGWDGRDYSTNAKSLVSAGVYIYQLTVVVDGLEQIYRGFVTVKY